MAYLLLPWKIKNPCRIPAGVEVRNGRTADLNLLRYRDVSGYDYEKKDVDHEGAVHDC
jgi:hypothetical protein